MLVKYEVCCDLFHGFDRSVWIDGNAAGTRSACCPPAQEHILAQEDGKERLVCGRQRSLPGLRPGRAGRRGDRASATTSPSSRPSRPRSSSRWSSERRSRGGPGSAPSGRSSPGRSCPSEVIDIFAAAGLEKPDISILSDEFLAEVREHAAAQPRGRAAAQAARRRDQVAQPQERRPGALLRRDARAGHPPLPEPGHRDRRRSSRS